jgi:hypothetical protein
LIDAGFSEYSAENVFGAGDVGGRLQLRPSGFALAYIGITPALRGGVMSILMVIAVGLPGVTAQVRAQRPDATQDSLPADPEYAQLIAAALAEFDAGHWAEARGYFERAHARRPNARTLWGLGVTAFELGRHAQAITELRAAIADTRVPLAAEQTAKAREIIARAEAHVAIVRVELSPSHARLWCDGVQSQSHELTLAPGEYTLTARADSYRDGQKQLTVVAGERRVVTIDLAPLDLSVRTAGPGSGAEAHGGAVQPGGARDRDDGGVLTSFWFWAAVGAVAIAGGVTAAVLISGRDDGLDSVAVDRREEVLTVAR